jgi:translation initiation factor IF-3
MMPAPPGLRGCRLFRRPRFVVFGGAGATTTSTNRTIASGRTYALDEEPPAIAPPTNNEPRINDRIRAREVRLVGPDGEQIGIKPLPEALNFARALDLDLVEVADKANPPVCRVMDYGKYKYETAQKAKESRRKSTNVVIKEMKYRPKIGGGDFDTKTRKVEKFLDEGHKVKITIMFRGREVAHPELGKKILDRVAEEVVHTGRVEVYPKLDGPRNMIMVLAPDKKAQAEAKKRAQTEEVAEAAPADAAPEAAATEAPATAEAPAPVESPAPAETPESDTDA